MNQSGIIGAALIVGFIVYVTAKGRLGQYLALFLQNGNAGFGVSPNASVQPAPNPWSIYSNPLPNMQGAPTAPPMLGIPSTDPFLPTFQPPVA